jgi:PAS domain S-box-containing protein
MDTQRDGADSSGRLMSYRQRLGLLVLILILVAVGVAVTATVSLFRVSLQQQRQRLVEIARSQARLIEATARFANEQPGQEGSAGAGDVVIRQVADAHKRFAGLGETGEFTLARREGERIVFLLRCRHLSSSTPPPVSFDGERAEPMRRALLGDSGTVIGLDYRGQEVIAAFEPVAELGLGIVAKIDLDEIREPFFRVGLVVSGFTLILVLTGAALFHRIYNPVVVHFEESERKYRSVYSSAPLAFVIWDSDCRIVDWNEQAERVFGWSFEEVQGRSFFDLIIPDSARAQVEQIVEALLSGQLPRQVVNENVTKDGRLILCEWNNAIRCDSTGKVVGAISLGLDISKRHQAEQDLRESEQRFHSLFQSMNESVVLHDVVRDDSGAAVDYRILDVNPAFEAMVSIDRERAVGSLASELYGSGEPPYLDIYVEVAESGRPTSFETYFPPMDKHFAISVFSPGPDRFATVSLDISERKRSEQELAHLNDQLAEKNRELEQIVYVASHDLRSPLVNVQGYCKELEYSIKELVEQCRGGDEARRIVDGDIVDALHFIRQGAARMDVLLTGLLKISRLGRAALKVDEVDMNQVMAEVVGAIEYQIKESGATVDVADLPSCRADSTHVGQVFANLLDNAVKYLDTTRRGHIKVTGLLREGMAVYSVEDNGVGIAEDHQSIIFEIFHRLNPDQGSGEGLGLTIVQRLLARLGGSITVESTPGRGSCFSVCLPVSG